MNDLNRFLSQGYGHLRDVLVKDGFAFVEFEDTRDAEGNSIASMKVAGKKQLSSAFV